MRFLFLLAHPDDEAIGCGGTIRALANAGYEVIVVTATDGGAGEGGQPATLGKIRREEFKKSCKILGAETRALDFEDGEITNKTVWGKLTNTLVEVIDAYRPDFVVTFDHSGWYFHLDHIGVSIAATVAMQQAEHKAHGLLLVFMKPVGAGTKWKYVFPQHLPITHTVDVKPYLKIKLKAMEAHATQDTSRLRENMLATKQPQELYQLVFADKDGKTLLEKTGIFRYNK